MPLIDPCLTADDVVRILGLTPHPEGGSFRETFRDLAPSPDVAAHGRRAASTAIYYLLREGEVSHWHRVDAAEIWHWHAGAPLELRLWPGAGPVETATLGIDLAHGQRPQGIVPAGVWQSASSTGAFSLVGCTVAPGFEFSGFEMAPPGFSPDGA